MRHLLARSRSQVLLAVLLLSLVSVPAARALGDRPSRRAMTAPLSRPHERVRAGSAALTKLVGQLLIGSFTGTVAPRPVLTRIRRGQLGGVILFSDNTAGGLNATRSLVGQLQAAATQGRNPPLLVMTDQEGGEVRRLPGPPTMNANQMSAATMARAEGVATGRLLRSVGINLDLAPVADVEAAAGGFLGPRAFGATPAVVAARACAFAAGLASVGVGYTLKHFPGLGLATTSTDLAPVTIGASTATLQTDWAAYRKCANNRMAAVMISSAIYPHLTGPLPAVESSATYAKALPQAVDGHASLTISDDLGSGALAKQPRPLLHALRAGLDQFLLGFRTFAARGGLARS
ncbi:MAG: glycoside hydrolase family 3 N-terminal domain-containing protein [Solirubrobacteraceae bacterium]